MTVNPVYIGIDQSVGGFGLSILCPEGTWHETVVTAFPLSRYGGQGVDQLVAVEYWLLEALRDISPQIEHIVMEGYAHGADFGREKAGELGYAVKRTLNLWMPNRVRYPTVVPPTQVKQFATGKGKASKQEMMDAVAQLWDVEFKNDNAADAYVMARIAYALDTDVVEAPFQKQVLAEIRAPKQPKKKRVRQKAVA